MLARSKDLSAAEFINKASIFNFACFICVIVRIIDKA